MDNVFLYEKYCKYLNRLFLAVECLFSFGMTAFCQIPTDIDGISAWWCADSIQQDAETNVMFWENMVNTTESVSQSVEDYSPTLVKNVSAVNNHAVLHFDGNDYLDGGNIMNVGSSGQTVFIIGKTDKAAVSFYAKSVQAGSVGRVYYLYNNSAPHFQIQIGSKNFVIKGENRLSQYELVSTKIDLLETEMAFFQNDIGIQKTTISSTTAINTSYNFLIGAYNNAQGTVPPATNLFLDGDIAEMIFYNRPLSNIERQSVENYLRSKYFPGTEREQFDLGDLIVQDYSLKPVTFTVPDRSYFQSYSWSTGETTQSISVQESGLYSVLVTDDWGYEYVDTVEVRFPAISYIQDQTICDGQSVTWDCGLSGDYTYLWSTGETTQSISITKAGDYSVTVTDNEGYSLTSNTVHIAIDDFSTSAKLGSDTTLCIGNMIGLQTRADEVVSYLWSTGETTATIAVDAGGEYIVTAKNSRGCAAVDTINVSIKGIAPTVAMVSTNRCEGDKTELVSNSYTTDNTEITMTLWTIEESVYSGTVCVHTFSAVGDIPVQLSVTNETGCVRNIVDTVTIHPKPVASFAPLNACQYTANNIMSTTSIASGEIASYVWQGQGISGEGDTITFRSDTAGAYPLTLTVLSDYGCSDTVTASINVRESTQELITHTKTCLGDTVVVFDATAYEDYNSLVEGYWLFGSKKYNYASSVKVFLADTLPHPISLHVKTFNGCYNRAYDTLQAHDIPYPDLDDTIYGCPSAAIWFHDEGTSVDSIAHYYWLIDGIEYSDEHVVTEFEEAGIYEAHLGVETKYGCVNTTSALVVIEKAPTAAFTFYPAYGVAPLDVQFTNTSTNASRYEWIFEQEHLDESFEPSYVFTDEENSLAKLRAYSEHGCADSVIKYVPLQLADLKLKITDVTAVLSNGKVTYTVQVLNTGNDDIPKIELALQTDSYPLFSEVWEGSLAANTVLTYTFATRTTAVSGTLPQFICATAGIKADNTDDTYATDSYCEDNSGQFQIYRIYPTPVRKQLYLACNTTSTDPLTIEFTDATGRVTFSQEFTNLSLGYNNMSFDVNQLPAGVYWVRLRQGNQTAVDHFVKE